MSQIGQFTFEELNTLKVNLNQDVQQVKYFEGAAQLCTAKLYQQFKESMVLVRVFATVPYGRLPTTNKASVDKLALSKQVNHLLHPQTSVLSLFGSSGINAAWNDRKQSRGHVGIPLVSAAFIEAIPMMSRLLKQLGVRLDWITSNDSQVITKAVGSMSGFFYVADAASEVDIQGRKIIAAQDFVNTYGVKTVFGFGGGYLGTDTFTVTIIFLRDLFQQSKAELFSAVCSLKGCTAHLVKQQSLFA
jgi:hypothetical protein